ncbi:MAG: HD domain-containing protein [Candidatus Micrarchaeota archaeon]|nr:HD domain-containing protein [Candidatus Micrarchaeota archaeon]
MAYKKNYDFEKITKFIFEIGLLKRAKRTGWWFAGVKDPESIAEHSYRTAIIAYILARMEGCERAKEIAILALFHDTIESRIVDVHKVHSRYIPTPSEVKKKIKSDQISLLPKEIKDELENIESSLTEKEMAIIKDADHLETAFQGKEYLDIGYEASKEWIERTWKKLKTKSAKEILKNMIKIKSSEWFKGLKEE